MKTISIGIILLFTLLTPLANAQAEAICACYFGENENCEYYYDLDGVSFPSSRTECSLWCNEEEHHPDTTRPDWAQDSDSDAGINVGAECDEADALATEAAAVAATPSSSGTTPTVSYAKPQLEVTIPGVDFITPAVNNGYLESNFIGTYISGVYKFLIGFAIVIAIVMMMIGGLQYVAGATSGDIEKAKTRIRNAVEGFVLLLFVYVVLYTVNPQLTVFNSLSIETVDQIKLDRSASGPEGEPSKCPGISKLSEMPEPYKTIIANAKSQGQCSMTNGMRLASPTGKAPNCGKHHWYDRGRNGDWKTIDDLDYAAPWGEGFKAPFDGVATYEKRTSANNQCGNTITLTGSGASIAICHAKDFIGADGTYKQDRVVKQGEVMGHLGGNCCAGETPPATWAAKAGGWCNKTGTECTDPTKTQSCTCQGIEQAGNTTGPHVHISWYYGGNMLACLKED